MIFARLCRFNCLEAGVSSVLTIWCLLGVQLEEQNFYFNAHSCTWIKNSLSTSIISALSRYACCGDATGCVIGEISV